jgi:hypothetical protein
MSFLRQLKSFVGMLQRLLGMLMSGLVIFLAVMRGRSAMRVGGEFMEFCSALVRVIWHNASRPGCLTHSRTIPFFDAVQ